jgi:L-Ala-D/L-Glu epimerase
MFIRSIRASLRNLALAKPYTIATKTVSDVESVFFEVVLENGITGLGAANPAAFVVGESPSDSFANLQTETIERLLMGADIRHFQRLIDDVANVFPNRPGTLAAVDIALHDAFCQFIGVPVAAFYGQYHTELPTSVTIGIKNVSETLEEAAEYHAQGFRVLKVKTGLHAEEDAERILRLRERYGDYFTIRVDANQGYEKPDLHLFLQKTAAANVELIEQPFPVNAEHNLLDFPEKVRRLMAADESLTSPRSSLHWANEPQLFGIYNIKLMKCGGIRGAMDIARVARHAGIDLFWGCNDESCVSIAAALHAAFANPHTRYLDLDGSFDLAKDAAIGGFTVKNGVMRLTDATGIGCKLL